jgi:hypothetical protein
VTIFIIIGIVIVALGVLIYSFYPQISSALGLGEKTPTGFIQNCLEDEIKNAAEELSVHGGDFNPELYSTFNNIKIKNLCYTSLYCDLCKIQEPQLKSHIENEILNEIGEEIASCFDSLRSSYERRGYDVTLQEGAKEVELLPKRIVSTFNYSLTLTKGDTQRYDSFSVVLNNNLYELTSIASSILDFETRVGNSDARVYMTLYPNIKVEKKLLSDGTKIYIITDRNTRDKFEFASRSLVLSPAGYC